MHRKTYIILLFFILSILSYFTNFSYAKYIIEENFTIANINLDNTPPKFELLSVSNTNTEYQNYANNTHVISARFKLIETNIKTNNFSKDTLKLKIGDNIITPHILSFYQTYQNSNEIVYRASFSDVPGDGILQFLIPEGTVKDQSRFR